MRTLPELTCLRSATIVALACGAIWSGAASATQTPAPGARIGTQAVPTVYRCETQSGRVQFSDIPCQAGTRGSAWSRPAPAPGIVASGGARPGPASHALLGAPREPALAGPSEPWAVCRQRGGSFDMGARVCKLPADTVEHMFLAD